MTEKKWVVKLSDYLQMKIKWRQIKVRTEKVTEIRREFTHWGRWSRAKCVSSQSSDGLMLLQFFFTSNQELLTSLNDEVTPSNHTHTHTHTPSLSPVWVSDAILNPCSLSVCAGLDPGGHAGRIHLVESLDSLHGAHGSVKQLTETRSIVDHMKPELVRF